MEKFRIFVCEKEEDLQSCHDIRREVFHRELLIDGELARDPEDRHAAHFLAMADGYPVATACLLLKESIAVIGRMAVLPDYRSQGVGRQLLDYITGYASEKGAQEARLSALASARTFFFSRGFSEDGAPYLEAGRMHIDLRKDLSGIER